MYACKKYSKPGLSFQGNFSVSETQWRNGNKLVNLVISTEASYDLDYIYSSIFKQRAKHCLVSNYKSHPHTS